MNFEKFRNCLKKIMKKKCGPVHRLTVQFLFKMIKNNQDVDSA